MLKLTNRDKDILRTLAKKVRMMTADQVAQGWWKPSTVAIDVATRRLRALKAYRLLDDVRLPAHPMLDLSLPLLTWKPGQSDPDYYAISYRLTSRWPTEYLPTTVYMASDRAVRMFGLSGAQRIQHPDQATHDLHLSAVYLRLLQDQPVLAQAWVGEDEFAAEREGQKLPDAVAKDAAGNVVLVIEFGGKYDPERFKAFHEDCRKRGTPYQLW